MKIVACNSNRPLAEAVAAALNLPLTRASVRRFADMEVFVEIHENVRGEDVFVVQSTSYPANDNLMELLITLDALRRASARRVTAVIPVFRLCPAGPEIRLAHADQRQAGGQPDHRGRRQPRADHGSACRADSGLLRHPGGQPATPRRCSAATSRSAIAGRDIMIVSPDVGGVLRARAHRHAAELRSRHHRQAARAGRRLRGDERDRRRRRARLHPGRRHRRFRRHAVQRGGGADRQRRHARPASISRMACCRAARWRASPPRRSR